MLRLFISRTRPAFLLTLLLAIASLHMVTYSAFFQSQDTTRIFDAASSLARYGDLGRDETLYREPPQSFNYVENYPLVQSEITEPIMPIVVSLWYRLVDRIPVIGLVHGTWLFNILVTSTLIGIFWLYAHVLGYSEATATLTAILLGASTILWVYSKTLFREPLVALFLLIAILLIERGHKVHRMPYKISMIGSSLILTTLAIYTKNSALFALPTIAVMMLPPMRTPKWSKVLLDGVLLFSLLLITMMALNPSILNTVTELALSSLSRIGNGISITQISNLVQNATKRIQDNLDYAQPALHTYLISIGGSLWGTSPIFLFAIPGGILLNRSGQRRITWGIALMIVFYALGHAFSTGQHWFGGVSWPPRFLVPVAPFVMIGVLPVIEWLLKPERNWTWRFSALVVAAYSTLIQIIGALSIILVYGSLLPIEANGLFEWAGGLNDVRYLRWVLLPRSWDTIGFDTAWTRIQSPEIGLTYLALFFACVVLLWRWQHTSKNSLFSLIVMIAFTLTTAFGLNRLYKNDRQFDAGKQPLFDMLEILEEQAEDGQPLILEGDADVTYDRFIMNYNRVDTIRPIVIGFPPGEATSATDTPAVISDYPPQLLVRMQPQLMAFQPRVLDFLANHHQRVWFLSYNSDYLSWSVRPVERHLATNYYLLNEHKTTDPTVRLLEFSTAQAPNRYELRLPENTTNLRYGDAIHPLGFTLPEGTTYSPGDALPITLWWQTEQTLADDYVVAWFLAKDDFSPNRVQGQDSMPDANFSPTSTWMPDVPVWDNRALSLPDDIPAGTYNIWIILYKPGADGSERLPITSGTSIDETIGVLPITILVDR